MMKRLLGSKYVTVWFG